MRKHAITLVLLIGVIFIAASCGTQAGGGKNQPVEPTPEPTPTEAPMAARVNGEGILQSDFDEELLRYQQAVEAAGNSYDPTAAAETVLDELINQTLLVQGASQDGYISDDAQLQSRLEELTSQSGGTDALNRWISDNHYSQESFRRALQRDMAAVWMRNRIVDSVPKTADQIHARQILVRSENEAVAAQRRLEVGMDFKELAYEYDPLTGGELGWFPAGYLLQPAVEAAAFSLQPGQYSSIIQTSYGYHIVFVIERDANHPLSADALLIKQREALEKWFEDRRAQSTIESYVP